MPRILVSFVFLSIFCNSLLAADDRPPRSLDPRLKIELFAEQPQLNTPTGIDVDHRGRVWVIESNTHFRPDDYQGHASDRLLVMQDTDGDGRADDVKMFADGFTHAMSVAVRPVWMEEVRVESPVSRVQSKKSADPGDTQHSTLNTQLFLATRREILLLEDTDGDNVCDKQTTLVRLETKGNYPHNGLAGFAFDALDWVYFGFGENLGEPYKIIGRSKEGEPPPSGGGQHDQEQVVLSGGGEGGNIYRMRPDGTQLQHWATGFWNPHASCVDAFGRLFTVDNDPDSLPPCRLLHIIEGGDYGYRFRNGRKGLHPFTAWNGEIPGTLPMVAGTGEAPSGIVAYEHDAFPEEYLGNLIVTSWGDHRIDRFVLKPKGASFESIAEPIIQGGENFRPVGIALSPDGSLYCSDWVLRDYNLHGKGRVWRISAVGNAEIAEVDTEALTRRLASRFLVERRLAARSLVRKTDSQRAVKELLADYRVPARQRIEILWAISRVPLKVHDFGLRMVDSNAPNAAPIAAAFDEVATAAVSLIGSPQFPFDCADGLWVDDGLTPATWFRNRPISTMKQGELERFDVALRYLKFDCYREIDKEVTNRLSWRNEFSEFLMDFLDQHRDDSVNNVDPFMTAATVVAMSRWGRNPGGESLVSGMSSQFFECFWKKDRHYIGRAWSLLAARRAQGDGLAHDSIIRLGLTDAAPDVRRLAVQWVAEEGLSQYRDLVEWVLRSEPMTTDLFLATLAALEMLDGKNPKDFDQTPAGKYVLPLLTSDDTPDAVRVQALRLVDPADPVLTAELMQPLVTSEDPALSMEAVRTLASSPLAEAGAWLLRIAANESADYDIRGEAILGLANVMVRDDDERIVRRLVALLPNLPYRLRGEAFRSLRSVVTQYPKIADDAALAAATRIIGSEATFEPTSSQLHFLLTPEVSTEARQSILRESEKRPTTDEEWRNAVSVRDREPGYPDDETEAGRRVFFHPNGPGCFTCHTVNGRGGKIGPDLSTIGRSTTREKLIDSILEPSKEIAPQFTAWNMLDTDGIVHTGMIVHENQGKTTLGTTEGKLIELETINIETREPHGISVMPDKLEERMTVQEFRDLLAFVQSLGVN